jgi:hypothetical protein
MKKKINCSQIYSIESICLIESKGCAKLSPLKPSPQLNMIWDIKEFPVETQGMPGSLYTVQVNFTIFDKTSYINNLLSGQFVYNINSGTLVKYSKLGIPFGIYMFGASSIEYDLKYKISLSLTEDSTKLIISSLIY